MELPKIFRLDGKVAIVTGGAGLLGAEFTSCLADAGCRVILGDLDEKKGAGLVKELTRGGRRRISFRPVNIVDPSSVHDFMQSILRQFRRIDILVNAAMSTPQRFYAPVETYRWEDWNDVMSVNVGGTFLCSQAVGEIMKRRREGVIVNIGSIYGVVAPDQRVYGTSAINSPAVYAASKAAVIQLTKYLAVYWAPYGIRVNCISPGGISNRQKKEFVRRYNSKSPLGRMVNKQDLRGALLFLLSSSSSAVTGHNLLVDGGWTAW